MQSKIENSSGEYQKKLQRLERVSQHALEVQRRQIEEGYKAAKLQAVEDGDTEEFQRLESEQAERVKQFSEPEFEDSLEDLDEIKKPEPEPEDKPQEPPAEVKAWVEKNSWFQDDAKLRGFAQGVSAELKTTKPGLTIEEHLEEVLNNVRETFPQKFGKQSQSTSVAGGGRMNGLSTRSKGWGDISSEDQKFMESWIRKGVYADKKEAAEAYWKEE